MDRQQLEQVLLRVDPSVRLVDERHLRRGLGRLADLGHRVATGMDHARRLSLRLLDQTGDFPASVFDGDGDNRLLLVEPGDRIGRELPDDDILRVYWELLFEAAVIDRLTTIGAERWGDLGEVSAVEAKFRLRRGGVVPTDATPGEQYAAFVAEFLTLRRFAPEVLAFTYPSIDPEAVERLAAKDVDAVELFARTRPDGAADPGQPNYTTHLSVDPSIPPPAFPHALNERATRAAATGNLVRAALLRTRTSDPAGVTAITEGLIPSLAKLFVWGEVERKAWAEALVTVLPSAARGYWSPAAMGLYDLQKITIDLNRELYAIDPAAWVRSLFRRPLVRRLTIARSSVLLKHLHAARNHFARLPGALADPILTLLDHEIADADAALRDRLRPAIQQALAGTLNPRHLPEVVARDTIAEELIDAICQRGHARLGDLRDAVARHSLKLDDLAGSGEFVRGDALLRADAALGQSLDGLYHPGELYLRVIQRGSSLAFGTRVGRWLTRFVVLPLGGAVMTVEFAKYIWHELGMLYGFLCGVIGSIEHQPEPVHETAAEHPHHKGPADLFTPPTLVAVAVLALLFLGLMHSPAFRTIVGRWLRHLGNGWRFVFVTVPLWVWNSPPLRVIRTHPIPRILADRLGWAVVAGVTVGAVLWAFQASWTRVLWWAGGTFAVLAVLMNSPPGRWWQDRVEDAFSDVWRALRRDFFPNLLGFITWLFREALGAIDRFIYTVDERLRFREGQSKPTVAGKVVLAFLWYPVAYIWRFAFYLLIEPQVNPVKHFPVVTVSHKLLIPMIKPIADSTGLSIATVGGIASGIPGIFGFIVWELKENWRLYAANRPPRLRPLAIGHHGETVYGLLTPGFHSGTVPVAFEKARTGLIRERHTGRPAKVRKRLDELHHAEEAVRRLVARELLALARTSRPWAGVRATVGAVQLGLQRITAEVLFAGGAQRPTVIEFARLNGAIVGRVIARGELDRLNTEQLAVWNQAMKGLLARGAAADGPVWREWVEFWDRQAG